MMKKLSALFVVVALVATLFVANDVAMIPEALAQVIGAPGALPAANIRATRHNLSSSPPDRKASSENQVTSEAVPTSSSTEICVYCHTPHAAVQDAQAPLWNRQIPATTSYTPYSSSSLNASDLDLANLATPSKLCLSCHDGSIAIGAVSNAPGSGAGSGTPKISVSNTASGGVMPFGRGQSNADHGFTRRLGNDLRNDHPIAFTYDTALAVADGELRNPAGSTSPTLIADRALGSPKPNFPLVGGQVQCSTCHDPHRNTQKFLLKNRLAQGVAGTATAPEQRQVGWGSNWVFSDANDQICLGCHTRLGKAWGVSAHANSVSADEVYNPGDAAMRDFPTGTKVWQAGCLNCHDTHTVAGSRRLLREGVIGDPLTVSSQGYSAAIRPGVGDQADYSSTSALENTCFQCHSGSSVLGASSLSDTEGVPNIKAEFDRDYRMPITNADQGGNSSEVHDITDADGAESRVELGFGNPGNRHVECTDCHNPHRVVKADTILGGNLSDGIATTARRTHIPARGATGSQGNIASGALRGAWGVEPSYTAFGQTNVTSSSTWLSAGENPSFTVKKGDPGGDTALPVGTAGTNTTSYLTREYQLCFKCHSSYANGPLATDFPLLGRTGGSSVPNEFDLLRYTNVAAEFAVLAEDPPKSGTHQGEATHVGTACNNGDCIPVGSSWDTRSGSASTVNHRSWHPVVFPTGRTAAERGSASFDNLRPPFNTAAKIGLQTMQCSDCHGAAGSWSDGSGPNLGQVQGPHGSDNLFLLKGGWTGTTRINGGTDWNASVCLNCHLTPTATNSGFDGDHEPDGNMASTRCMSCHIAIPHGWKNKAFLANLNCVGTEGGEATDCVNRTSWGGGLTVAPYYNTAYLSVTTWQRSRFWGGSQGDSLASCGGDAMKNCADGD